MEHKSPLVSILIPVYNHAKYVGYTLDSILNDNYINKELLIIDDGSSDNSIQIIEEWLEKNNKKINFPINFIYQENIGVIKTLNKGLELVNGKYFLPLASDDYLINTDSIQKRVDYLEGNNHLKAIFSDACVVDAENKLVYESGIEGLHKSPKKKLEEYLETDLILFWCVPGAAFIANTQYIKDIGGYKEGGLAEDRYLYLKILADKKLGFFNEIVGAYRWHGGNSCFVNKDKIFLEVLEMEKEMLPLFKGKQKLALHATILRREWVFQKDNNPTLEQLKLREVSLSIMEYLNSEASEKYQKEIERVTNLKPFK